MSSLVQAIGRLRPEQRGPNALVHVFRPMVRLDALRENKRLGELQYSNLVSMGILNTESEDFYWKLFSYNGLYDFLRKKTGCFLVELAKLYGFDRRSCERCSLCLSATNRSTDNDTESSPLLTPSSTTTTLFHEVNGSSVLKANEMSNFVKRNIANAYGTTDDSDVGQGSACKKMNLRDNVAFTKSIATVRNEEDKRIRREAECVFSELLYRCIICGEESCNGEHCCTGCYHCGDPCHNTRSCGYTTAKLKLILPGKGVCFGCYDTMQRGIRKHNIKECPLHRRLRRLLFSDRSQTRLSFDDYLRRLYVNEMTFLRMVAGFSDKVLLGG